MTKQEENLLLYTLLSRLMAADTVNPPGNEQNAAEILKELFDAHKIPCEIQELGDNRANFIAHIGSGAPTLEFNGHLDVVPCAGEWENAPLAATIKKDRLFGRGACDMKGGVAAMCVAALSLFESNAPLKGTLRLCFVADEENANLGTHALQKQYPAADYAVIGEPTMLNVAVAHRGAVRSYIDVYGKSRHAALPPSGVTATTFAARAILALDELNEELRAQTHEVLPPSSVAVTMVSGYEKDNIIPSCVRLLTDYRVLPSKGAQQAQADIKAALNKAGVTDFDIKEHFVMRGGEMPVSDSFVKKTCEITAQTLKRGQKPCAFDASCEQCFLIEAGTKAVILGPGGLTQAHTVDEFVEISQLEQAVDCYKALAEEILKGEKI